MPRYPMLCFHLSYLGFQVVAGGSSHVANCILGGEARSVKVYDSHNHRLEIEHYVLWL